MYHTVDIQTLSPKQISRILNGHAVRVKMGSGTKMHVSTEHAKKLHRAHKKGGAATVTLDPYAIEHNQHLRTRVGRIAHKARGGTALIDQPFTARQAVDTTGRFFKDPKGAIGYGGRPRLHGKGPIKKFKAWTGAIGDFLKPVAKPILDAGTQAAVRQIQNYGQGARKGLPPMYKGDGFFEDLGKVAKSAGKKVVKQIANEVVQYAGPAAGTAFAAAATAAGQPEFAPAAALLGNELGTRAGQYANKRIQGMGKGGTALIDQPFTARQAVDTTGRFFKDPKGAIGYGVPKMLKKDRPKRVMSDAQKAALAKGRAALRIKLNEMGAGSGGAARPAGYGMDYC